MAFITFMGIPLTWQPKMKYLSFLDLTAARSDRLTELPTMSTAPIGFESDSQLHEKHLLVERFRASVTALIGPRLPRQLQCDAESIHFSDLLELVIELDCLDGTRCETNDVIRMIVDRVEDSAA